MRCTLATCACSRASCARRWNKRAALLLAPPQTLARACTRPSLGTCTTLCRSHAPARALARVHAARARVRNCLCLRRRKQMRLVASCQLGRDFCLGIARAADAAPVAAQQTHQTTDQPMIIFAPVVSTILHRVPMQSMRWFAYIPIPHIQSTDSDTLGHLNVYSSVRTNASHSGKCRFNKSSSELSKRRVRFAGGSLTAVLAFASMWFFRSCDIAHLHVGHCLISLIGLCKHPLQKVCWQSTIVAGSRTTSRQIAHIISSSKRSSLLVNTHILSRRILQIRGHVRSISQCSS